MSNEVENKLDTNVMKTEEVAFTENKKAQTKSRINNSNGGLVIEVAIDDLKKYLKSHRRINCPDSDIDKVVSKLCDYVRLFNSLGEFDTWCLDTTLDKIPIPNEFVPFILPSSVRFVPSDRRTKDLLIRDNFNSNKDMSLSDLYDTISNLRRIEKKGSLDEITSLDSIHKPSSYNDVLDRVFTKDNGFNVRYDSTPFVPLLLKDEATSLFEKTYFNTSFKVVLKHYIAMKG